jgi:hypothetical protein
MEDCPQLHVRIVFVTLELPVILVKSHKAPVATKTAFIFDILAA